MFVTVRSNFVPIYMKMQTYPQKWTNKKYINVCDFENDSENDSQIKETLKECNIKANIDPNADMGKKMKMSSNTSLYLAKFNHVLLSTIKQLFLINQRAIIEYYSSSVTLRVNIPTVL